MSTRTIRVAVVESLGAQLNLTAKAFTSALAARLPDGLTTTQVGVLSYLAEAPGMSQREIAAATGVDTATLAEMLRRLEQRGMVRRSPDPVDARRMLVRLGEFDPVLLDEALQAARDVNEIATRGLTEDERGLLGSLLARLRSNLTG